MCWIVVALNRAHEKIRELEEEQKRLTNKCCGSIHKLTDEDVTRYLNVLDEKVRLRWWRERAEIMKRTGMIYERK